MKKTKSNSTDNAGKLTRREFIGGAVMLGVGATLAGGAGNALASMAPIPKGAAATVPTLTISDPGAFKILQVTDIHMHFLAKGILGEPGKVKALQAMAAAFKPDIIVNTGDFWATVSGAAQVDNAKGCTKEIVKMKTPWAFAWGNHDESIDYAQTHEMMETAPYSLYRGGAADGNYRIEVRAKDGAAPVWNLIILNNSRGGFKPEQIDWFNAEAGRIKKETPASPPAFLFFHIPIPQYEDVALSGKAVGVKFEKVCHENGSRDALPAFKKAGFVKATFCGHDHVNDYHGVMDGIRLQYGRALGGYGEDKVRKGASLITVDTVAKTFETKSVFEDGTSVVYDKFIQKPEPGKIY
ncbi:MAG: metallophosphoesterase [bacterium]